MRLFELTELNRTVVATNRFVSDLAKLAEHMPEAIELLDGFIKSKVKSSEKYSRKDDPFRNGNLSGIWHWHLLFGKIIVFYQLTPTELRLITITNHKMIDGPPPRTWGQWIANLKPSDYHPFALPSAEIYEISDDEKSQINKIFWEMAVNPNDRGYLVDIIDGNWSNDVVDFLIQSIEQPMTPEQKWDAILRGFGGLEGITATIQAILDTTNL